MRAHWRPSLIAHTISDCPRRASPAAKIPSTEVVYGLTTLMFPRASRSTPSCSNSWSSGPTKPIASSTSCAGIPAADHDDVGALGADLRHARGLRQRRKRTELARYPAVALVQVVHREVDAAQLAAGHRQIARHARPRRQHDRVKAAAQLLPT